MASGTIKKYADGADSSWIELTDTRIIGKLVYRKIGDIFQIKSNGWTKLAEDLPSGATRIIANIPDDGYRPGIMIGLVYINAVGIGVFKIESGNIAILNCLSQTMIGGSSGNQFMINTTGFFA